MRIPRLFCPQLVVGINPLDSEEAHHAVHVLRLTIGDEVLLFDGAGRVGSGRIKSVSRQRTTVTAESVNEQPFDLRIRLTLAVAMAKAHRQSYLIEKCTELGVSEIWPLVTARSVAKPAEAAVEKWERRAIEVCKQSERAWVPHFEPPQTLEAALSRQGEFAEAMIAVPGAKSPIDLAISKLGSDARLLVFVGPEGGWTPAELSAFESHRVEGVSLSPTTLRVETAAVAVCAAVALQSCPRPATP